MMAEASVPSGETVIETIEFRPKDRDPPDMKVVDVEEVENKDPKPPPKKNVQKEKDTEILPDNPDDDASDSSVSTASDDTPEPRTGVAYVIKVLEKHLLAAKRELISNDPGDSNDDGEENYLGKIERLPMSDWMAKTSIAPSPRTVAFRVYYREVPTAESRISKASSTDPDSLRGSEQPLRVVISSPYLEGELVRITNMSMSALPILMKPPYKVIVFLLFYQYGDTN
ncbi:hypothetical protein F4805DRAFT_372666 [Annulohypoxylon moriforme]|nr:hypothetical protein F4805DRAFT_372666 [Annulohypoxylon moriforme]